MESLCAWLVRQLVHRLWWDDLPQTVERQGLLLAVCQFVGRVTVLGAVIGGAIGLVLGKADDELMSCAVNGICGLGALALFVVVATLYIDPDRMI